MGEILEFRDRDRTANGRFLLAVDQQEQEARVEQLAKQISQKPTAQQSARAKLKLDFIFSGANKAEAEELYRQGLDDIVHQRTIDSHNYTPAAAFYAYVQSLTEVANRINDHQLAEESCGAACRDWGYQLPDQGSPTDDQVC